MRSTRPPDAEIVDRALRLMREPLAGFVQEMMAAAVKEKPADESKLENDVAQIGRGKQIAELDTRSLLRLMERVWSLVFRDKPGKLGRSYAGELHTFSNARSHQEDRKTFGAERFVDTALRLLVECDVAPPDDLRDLRRVASPQARNGTKTFRLIGFDEGGEMIGPTGNHRLVCNAEGGEKIAIWGLHSRSNIEAVLKAGLPCRIKCECCDPKLEWKQKYGHAHWVPENWPLQVLKDSEKEKLDDSHARGLSTGASSMVDSCRRVGRGLCRHQRRRASSSCRRVSWPPTPNADVLFGSPK